ncbi:JmjN domain [Dillenia turbinata]|uniref:JmjN domain n=1 Tax=Dillenia turbinata TaxID=194707 RepID=A0AAN8VCA2_9MAGN
MASGVTSESHTEVFSWLKTLPLAPEYHPTLSEFEDPISYIFKIEKEASKYGICKIVPPVQSQSKKTVISNLNRSLLARKSGDDQNPKSSTPTFTTRQQQIGFCPRKHGPVQKPVWESGQEYTLQQFEARAKNFEKNFTKKPSKKPLSALEVETLFWKACVDKPFSVEYANDMPGSAFGPLSGKRVSREMGESRSVGDTDWNMRNVARANGSLLKFMKEEIPGVTSPMVYIAMMFSWFAWHVEDHDLHSLNYLHMGASKTWYGVPRDAAIAFEEVVRVHGYGEEINPLVTFAILGEKTTVMSPEVFIKEGIPCCRLVQNAGEFVVTFPRAYHTGFSHGFNCGEASNIATPEWLRVAKEAAIRRASINYPPMVSHFQLLYDLALAIHSGIPMKLVAEPRSSRLKEKKKGEGENLVKELFVDNVIQNNDLLYILGNGSPCVLLPENSTAISICSKVRLGTQSQTKPRLLAGLCTPEEALRASKWFKSDDAMPDRHQGVKQLKGFYSAKGKFASLYERERHPLFCGTPVSAETDNSDEGNKLADQRLFSCAACGILSFACVAVVQPTEAAARFLISADCSFLNDSTDSDVIRDELDDANRVATTSEYDSGSGWTEKAKPDDLYDVPVQSADDYQIQVRDANADDYKIHEASTSVESTLDTKTEKGASSLGLLALTYGDSSDSEEDQVEPDGPTQSNKLQHDYFGLPSLQHCHYRNDSANHTHSFSRFSSVDGVPHESPDREPECEDGHQDEYDCSNGCGMYNVAYRETSNSEDSGEEGMTVLPAGSKNAFLDKNYEAIKFSNSLPMEYTNFLFAPRSDDDSSRMHIFCLEHAMEVEQKLRPYGGVNILLLCHPEYPRIEAQARSWAEELGRDYNWNNIAFRGATEEDEERIQLALASEEAVPSNGDWAVKLGLNLYYSAILSRSPLYSKQMPYNSVIYNAFGRSSVGNSSAKADIYRKGLGKQKKNVVAGKWCGKVWMSNQVHHFLRQKDLEEEQGTGFFTQEPVQSWNEGCFPESGIQSQTKLEKKVEKKSNNISKAGTSTVARKTQRKRKMMVENVSVKRVKCPETEGSDGDSDNSLGNSSDQKRSKNLKNRQRKQENPKFSHYSDHNHTKLELVEDELEGGPSTRLRKRVPKPSKVAEPKVVEKKSKMKKKGKNALAMKSPPTKAPSESVDSQNEEEEYQCDLEGCTMSFCSRQDLVLHKRNICPVKDCGKKFFSHKYLVQHRRVHMDDRPLKCPWKGCKMSFKWAWARTEHIRVHTGVRPYVCNEPGCGQTFRFVSDFSRHKRKTGHSAKKAKLAANYLYVTPT